MNEPFVPIEDVAKHFSVSISTVRAWVRQKHIPEDAYFKIGKTYRFRVGDVDDALTKVTSEDTPSNKDDLVDEPYVPSLSDAENALAKRLGIHPEDFDLDEDL